MQVERAEKGGLVLWPSRLRAPSVDGCLGLCPGTVSEPQLDSCTMRWTSVGLVLLCFGIVQACAEQMCFLLAQEACFLSLVKKNVHIGLRLHGNDTRVNLEVSVALVMYGCRVGSADC